MLYRNITSKRVIVIHPSAIIHPSAQIAAQDVVIGPWTIIGENVEIGPGTTIDSHVVIEKNTRVGSHNHIFSHAILGTDPQHLGYKNEVTWLHIGDHNVIRECVTINRGTQEAGTTVGNHNYLMSYVHIAHDSSVGNHVIFANNASIAGHVKIGNHAILGAFSGVHQFVNIGAYSFLGRATKIYQDILPYMLVTGNPGVPRGLNNVGLRRHHFTPESIAILKQAYAIVYRRGLDRATILQALEQLCPTDEHAKHLLHAFTTSVRGIARHGAKEETLL